MSHEQATDMRGLVVKRVADSVRLYADFTEALEISGLTVSSVSVSCPEDAALTFGTATVLTGTETVPAENEQGVVVSRSIAAGKGCKVLVGAGTQQDSTDDPVRILWQVTLSDGQILQRAGRLRVE